MKVFPQGWRFKATTMVREIENAVCTATHKDYTESIDALDEGIQTLMLGLVM